MIASHYTLFIREILTYLQNKIGLYALCIGLAASIMGSQLIWLSATNTSTYDEPIHVLSGYATVRYSHILFDPEHPFLIKAISAVPLLFMDITYPPAAEKLSSEQRSIGHNTLYDALDWGYEMLYGQGNYGGQLLFMARLPMIAISLLLLFTAAWWVKKRWGKAASVAAAALLCFEPTLLAHGYLTNNDVAAGLAFLLGIIVFENWLLKQSWKSTFIAGGVLGIALLTKFTLLLLLPVLAIMGLVWLFVMQSRRRVWTKDAWMHLYHFAGQMGAIVIIGFAIVWAAYGLLAVINPDYNPWQPPSSPSVSAAIITTLTPPMYAKGALNMVPATDELVRTSYLLGQCYLGGRWDYFPVLLLTKAPIPVIVGWVLAGYYWWSRRRQASSQELFSVGFLFIGVAVSFIISATSSINIGFRHAMPAYILLLLFASTSVKLVDWRKLGSNNVRNRLKAAGFGLLGLWLVASSLSYWPNHLAYFNELTLERGRSIPFVASDSNADWGQSVKRLRDYMSEKGIKHIALASFNGYHEAGYYALPYEVADPANQTYKGYIALSRSAIIHRLCRPMDGPNWSWITSQYTPVAVIDNAINLYYIP